MSLNVDPAGIRVDPEAPLPAGSTVKVVNIDIYIVIGDLNLILPNQPASTIQARYKHIYTLTAAISGLTILGFIIFVSVLIPNPTPFQLRVWMPLLALAAAAFSGTITGMLNLKAKFGTQLVIGSSGALAVLVLFYLFKPAIF